MKRRNFLKTTTATTLGFGLGLQACQSSTKKNVQVLILGAGLSGLYAGLLLEKAGIEYQILEGSDRIGGRVFTHPLYPTPVEWGANQIAANSTRIINLAKALDLPLTEAPSFPEERTIHYRGQNIPSGLWAQHPINPLADSLKTFLPYQLEEAPFLLESLPVKSLTDWHQEYLANLDYPYRAFLAKKGFGEEAIRMADIAADHNGLGRVSTLQIIRHLAHQKYAANGKDLQVAGGMSQLPMAMQQTLSQPVLTNKRVISIADEVRSVRVGCTDGSSYSAEQVICTLPFSTLRKIQLQANLNGRQKTAIRHLEYTQLTQAIIGVKRRFWEQDQLPVAMWTDSRIEQLAPVTDLQGEEVYLKVSINGKAARSVDRMSPAELAKAITKTLHRIRPSTQNAIEVLDSFSWGKNPFSLGAYTEYHAGQVIRFVPQIAERTARIVFAGVHTSFAEKGMEGALASAERAVKEVL